MKKFMMVVSILMLICLCSCGSKTTREIVRDNPAADLKTALHLDDVANGTSLNLDLDTTKSFSDVKIATDASSTLFYQTIDLDEVLNKRLKQFDLKLLYFNGKILASDITSFLKEMNHKDYGLTAEKIGVTFKQSDATSKSEKECDTLFGKLSIKYGISIPKNYEVKENDPAKLVVAYLPTYCTFNDGLQDYTKVFLFIPVYYAFTYESTIDQYTAGMNLYCLNLTEDGLLPSQS